MRLPGPSSSSAPSRPPTPPGQLGALMAESSRSSSDLRDVASRPGRRRAARRPRPHRGRGARPDARLARQSRARLHRAPLGPEPPRRRDLVPGRTARRGEELLDTALREAEEEIGLSPDRVEVVGALPPIGTFVTNYKVHPFVGLIDEGMRFEPNPSEVESVLVASLDDLGRRIREAPAGPPRRPDQDRHLPDRGPADLGSDGPDPGPAARADQAMTDEFRPKEASTQT